MRKGRLLSLLLALVLALGAGPLGAGISSAAATPMQDEFLTEKGIRVYENEDGEYVVEDPEGTVITWDAFISGAYGIMEDGTLIELSGMDLQDVGEGDDDWPDDRQEDWDGYWDEDGEEEEGEPRDYTYDTWADFALYLNELADGAQGEILIRDEQVGGYQIGTYYQGADDIPLAIPEGVQVIFENCTFDGLVLSHGDITLRNTQVGAGGRACGISILEQPEVPRKTHLRLTIEEDSEVAPKKGVAIWADGYYRFPSTIEIINHGLIDGGMYLDRYGHWGRNTNTVLALYNYGTIRGDQQLHLSPRGGTMSLYVENSGLIEGYGIPLDLNLQGTRQTGKATLWNREGGIVRANGWSMPGVRMDLYDDAMTTKDWLTREITWLPVATNITGEIINEGVIEGGSCALSMRMHASNPSTLLLQGDGVYKVLDADAPMLDIQAFQSEAERDQKLVLQTQEEVEEVVSSWLEGMGFYYLPEGTRAAVDFVAHVYGSKMEIPDVTCAFDLFADGRPLELIAWADLVKQAEAAMTVDQRDICFYTQRQVLAPEAKDKALSVPEGQRLIFRGGEYEGMKLGGGDFTLSNVTVYSSEAQSALTVDGLGRPALRLVIEEGSSVLHHGEEGAALDIGGKFGKDPVIDIENHGVLSSDQQTAARIALAVTGNDAVTVRLDNDGSVSGKTGGLEVTGETAKGTLEVDIDNQGSMEAAEGRALAVRGASTGGPLRVHLLNQEGAEIASEGMEGVWLSLAGAAKEDVLQGAGGLVYNAGLIRGKDAAVRLMPGVVRPVRVRLRGEGTLEAEGAEVSVAFLEELKKGSGEPMAEEAFDPMRDLWLAQMGLRYLPAEAHADSKLLTRVAEKDGVVEASWYARLDQGGGEAMPSLAAELANFDAPAHLRTAGDGTIEAAELKLTTYPLQALTTFQLREDGRELWFDIHGEMVQYKEWDKLQKAKGQDIVLRGSTKYSVGGLLAAAYAEMLGRQKQAPVEGTLLKGREVFLTAEKLNEGLRLMHPEAAFDITGSEEEGFRVGIDGKTFWTEAKAKNPQPYLAEAPAAEDDIPFPEITVTENGLYLGLADAMTLYALYGGEAGGR